MIKFLLEPNIFGQGLHPMTDAVIAAGFEAVKWDDDWWNNERDIKATLFDESRGDNDHNILFHGSLGNAAKIAASSSWGNPGSYCNTNSFCCSNYYGVVEPFLIQKSNYRFTTVQDLVNDPVSFANQIYDDCDDISSSNRELLFVRPDSPLKPFSGRILSIADPDKEEDTYKRVSLRSLDHGFYYDDVQLPIVVSRAVSKIVEEYRFVVANRKIVASSPYFVGNDQQLRRATPTANSDNPALNLPKDVVDFAEKFVAETSFEGDPVYIVDVGKNSENEVGIIELNPFSGADLYNCNYSDIIKALSEAVRSNE